MIFANQSASYEAVFDMGITGLSGVIEMMLVDNEGNIVTASSGAGVVESPAGSGVYAFTRVAPATTGQYSAIASTDGTYDVGTIAELNMIVLAADGPGPLDPLPPLGQAGAPVIGPCSEWTTAEDAAACGCADVGTMTALLDDSIIQASEILFPLSGRQFSGSCQKTVRPCSAHHECGVQVLSQGHIVNWGGRSWMNEGVPFCGCAPLHTVPLAGYPVREIVQVKIDGAVVDPNTYRIDGWRWLVRTRELASDSNEGWPSCQALDLPDTQEGTFSVTYLYGVDPPMSGRKAAAELACELYNACAEPGECKLPAGVTRVTRQGVTFDRPAFLSMAFSRSGWRTGLPQVDAFLNAYNPNGLKRRPTIMSPDAVPYAPKVG